MKIINRLASAFSFGRTRPDEPGERHYVYLGPSREAGVKVDNHTALQYAAVWACVRVISEGIASMPWRVMSETDGKKETHSEHPADWVLHTDANPEMSAMSWRETMLAWALTWGNGYSEIVRDRAGRISELWPLSPDRVCPKRNEFGRLYYEIDNGHGVPTTDLAPQDVFHLRGLGFDGMLGYSVIGMHRKSVGLGLSMNESGAALFGNGGVPQGLIKYLTKIDAKVAADTRKEWNELYGGPGNRGRIAVLSGDMDYKPLTMPMVDAQYVETRNFQVEEICRIYRVPPHKVQHLLRATFNNIEHMAIEYVQDTLLPWAVRLEQEANRKLFGRNQRGRYFTKINLNSLMRGDSDARSRYYWQMFQMGALSTNEIRQLEDMGTIGQEGDKRLVQLNMTTLDKAGEQPDEAGSGDDELTDDVFDDEFLEDQSSYSARRRAQKPKRAAGGAGRKRTPAKKSGNCGIGSNGFQPGNECAATEGGQANKQKSIGAKVGKDEHVFAEAREAEIAKSAGGRVIGGYGKATGVKGAKKNGYPPADVVVKAKDGTEVVIEAKSFIVGKKNTISVHDDALLRKVAFEKEVPNRRFDTVVIDGRAEYKDGVNAENYSGHRMYYRRGSGRYSTTNMHKVKDAAELKRLINMSDDELPQKARGALPPPPPENVLSSRAEKAHASRLNKDRARKARLREERKARNSGD